MARTEPLPLTAIAITLVIIVASHAERPSDNTLASNEKYTVTPPPPRMDTEGEAGAPGEDRRNQQQQVDNAIRAIQEKKPRPEIDFTIHTMEDNTQVNTMERVCKGTCAAVRPLSLPRCRGRHNHHSSLPPPPLRSRILNTRYSHTRHDSTLVINSC